MPLRPSLLAVFTLAVLSGCVPIRALRQVVAPPARLSTDVRQSANGPGLWVCEPVVRGADTPTQRFATGCALWLGIVLEGQGAFGRNPTVKGNVTPADLGRKDIRLTERDLDPLARKLGITHAALGEISGTERNCTLTYWIVELPSRKRVGEPVQVSGPAASVLKELPVAALQLAARLGLASPEIPAAARETVTSLRALGGGHGPLVRDNGRLLDKLAPDSSLAPILQLGYGRGNENPAYAMAAAGALMKDFPGNGWALDMIASDSFDDGWGAQASAVFMDAVTTALQRHPQSLHLRTAEAYFLVGRKEFSEARAAAEQAVQCSTRSPRAWLNLGEIVNAHARDIRKGRFIGQISADEMRQLEALYPRALAAREHGVKLDPENAEGWIEVSGSAAFEGKAALAERALNEALRIRPGYVKAYQWGFQLYAPHWYGDRQKLLALIRAAGIDKGLQDWQQLEVAQSAFWASDARIAGAIITRPETRKQFAKWAREQGRWKRDATSLDASAAASRSASVPAAPPRGQDAAPEVEAARAYQHTSGATSVAWSPNGEYLASGGADRLLKLWRPGTGPPRDLLGHTSTVNFVAWSPDGQSVASADSSCVRIWAASAGRETATLEVRNPSGSGTLQPSSIAWSPDSTEIAVATNAKEVAIFDARTGAMKRTLQPGAGRIRAIAWSVRNRIACAGDQANACWVVDGKGEHKQSVALDHRDISRLAWSPTGNQLAGCSFRGHLSVADAATGKQRWSVRLPDTWLFALSWSADGKRLACGGSDTLIHIMESSTGREVRRIEDHNRTVAGLSWTAAGKRLASAALDRTVVLWDVPAAPDPALLGAAARDSVAPGSAERLPRPLELAGYRGVINAVALAPDGSVVFSAGVQRGILSHALGRSGPPRKLEGQEGAPDSLAVSPDGRLLASASPNRTLIVWDPASGTARWTWPSQGERVRLLTFTQDSSLLAGVSNERRLRVWNASNGTVTCDAELKTAAHALALGPDGRMLAVAQGAIGWGEVSLRDPRTGEEKKVLGKETTFVDSIAFSSDGGTLATGSRDGNIRLLDVRRGAVRRTLPGHVGSVRRLAWLSPRRLASAGQDGIIRIWDPASGRLLDRVQAYEGGVTSLAVSPDGKVLAAGGELPENEPVPVKVWRLRAPGTARAARR